MAFSTLIPASVRPPTTASVGGWANYLASQKSGLISDKFSIGGLVFDYAGEAKVELNADITDHYAEDNTVFQDHIALRPIRVTLKGLVGELVAGPQATGLSGLLQTAQTGFTTLQSYVGAKNTQYLVKASKAVSQAQRVSSFISNAYSRGKSLINFFKNGGIAPTHQAEIYASLETMYTQRQLFEVQTPFKSYKNMAIESMVVVQPEDTKYLSEFTVVMKPINVAKVVTDVITPAGVPMRMYQMSERSNKGQCYGTAKTFVQSDFLVR